MTHGSLFSGYGGFDLALDWHGVETIWQVEKEPYPLDILERHYPDVRRYHDIKDCKNPQHADIITGGFPCQPFSVAGKQFGSKDDRFLWHEMYRIIKEVSPCIVVAENVPGLLSQEGGMVFESICLDMENAGYEVQPVVLPAGGAQASHKRSRLWIIGYRADPEMLRLQCSGIARKRRDGFKDDGNDKHTKGVRLQTNHLHESGREEKFPSIKRYSKPETIYLDKEKGLVSESGVCGSCDGATAGVHRNKRIKACGNGIVPQVAYELFGAIFESLGL